MNQNTQPPAIFFNPPPFTGNDLQLRGVGMRENMKPCIVNRPNGTGDWLLMFFYDAVEVRGDGWQKSLVNGGMVIWKPGEGQYYGNRERKFCHSWVHCSGRRLEKLIKLCRISPGIQPAQNLSPCIEQLCRGLYSEAITERADTDITLALLEVFLRQLTRANRPENSEQQIPTNIRQLKQQIDARPQQPRTLQDMAEQTHLSRSHLCVLFRKHYGQPPLDYQIGQRLTLARHLLHDQNLRINEIARMCGYEDIYYFSRLFKKHTGHSPSDYRNAPAQKKLQK